MPSQPEKILLVDDEERVLSALRRRLAPAFDIATAASGDAALSLLDEDLEIAVIVADMRMPGMNGIDLLKTVKERAPAIRRIMLTGNADLETAMAAVNDGEVMRFLRKPCDIDALKAALSQALSERAFHASEAVTTTPRDRSSRNVQAMQRSLFGLLQQALDAPLERLANMAPGRGAPRLETGRAHSEELLTRLQRDGEHMLRLVERLLVCSQMSARPEKAAQRNFADIIMILTEEVERARDIAARKNIAVSLDSLRRRADIDANGDDIRIALRELLDNAVTFTPADGHVSVLVNCARDAVAVKIANTGEGPPPDIITTVQSVLHETNDGRISSDSRLGLALVATIADLHGGDFSIGAAPGGGGEATLVVPRRKELPTSLAAPQ
ncbi:MAG: hybrid sensor histidine kinase/response regulator [Pseudomonadota bacterium]